MAKGKKQFVFQHKDGWAVHGQSNKRYTRITKGKQEAYEIAKRIAMNQKSELIVFNNRGEIIDRDSFNSET